jgi:hypothetical protein
VKVLVLSADAVSSKMRSEFFQGILRGHYGKHLEVNDVAPVGDPLVEKASVVGFHELKAAMESLVNPA